MSQFWDKSQFPVSSIFSNRFPYIRQKRIIVGFILEFEDPDTKEIKTHNFVTNDAYTSLLVNEDVKNQIGASSTTVTPDMYDGTYFYGDMMNMKAKYADSPLRFRPYAKLLDGTYVYGKVRYDIDEITDKDDK